MSSWRDAEFNKYILILIMIAKDTSPELIQKIFDLNEPLKRVIYNGKPIFEYNNNKWEVVENEEENETETNRCE